MNKISLETWKICCRAYFPNCKFNKDAFGHYAYDENRQSEYPLSRYEINIYEMNMTEEEFLIALKKLNANGA